MYNMFHYVPTLILVSYALLHIGIEKRSYCLDCTYSLYPWQRMED